MMFNVHVREVEEDAMVGVHADDPGAVHVVWVAAGIPRRMDLPRWSSDRSSTACREKVSPLKGTNSGAVVGEGPGRSSTLFI